MRQLVWSIVAVGTTIVLGASCAADGAGVDEEALIDAIAVDLSTGDDELAVADDEARCAAEQIVDEIGADRLAELGVTPETAATTEFGDFAEAELTAIVDALVGCVDVRSLMADLFASDFGDEGARCVAGELSDDHIRQAIMSGFAGTPPSNETVNGIVVAIERCGATVAG